MDSVSVKMTALNFYIHGVRGSVLHMNSITNEFFGGYKVNQYLGYGLPLPHIELLHSYEDAFHFFGEGLRNRAEEKVVELLLSTGMRLSELVGLNQGDVDFSEREIIVFGKGAKQRIVYFDDRTNLFLQKYLETRDDDNPALFVQQKRRGDKYLRLNKSGLGTVVRMWGRACGIEEVHPHRFRRTMATRALRAGMPIEQIQVILGHSSIETTRIYAKVNQDDVKYAHRKYVR